MNSRETYQAAIFADAKASGDAFAPFVRFYYDGEQEDVTIDALDYNELCRLVRKGMDFTVGACEPEDGVAAAIVKALHERDRDAFAAAFID